MNTMLAKAPIGAVPDAKNSAVALDTSVGRALQCALLSKVQVLGRTAIAAHPALQVSESTLCRWISGESPIPARKIPGLYLALGHSLHLFALLARPVGLCVSPIPQVPVRRSVQRLAEEMLDHTATALRIAGKLQRDEPLSEEELSALEKAVVSVEQAGKELLNVARQRNRSRKGGDRS